MTISDYIGETTTYDKKLMLERKEPISWLKSVSAFANMNGGVLIFGVDDDGTLVGLADSKKDSEDLSEAIKCDMDPVPEFELELHEQDGKRFMTVRIAAGNETPYYVHLKGHRDAFVRIGNESVKANATQLKRLVLKSEKRSWDSLTSKHKRTNAAFEALRERYHKVTKKDFAETDFVSFGLVAENGLLTNAGALLADGALMRHSRVFCTRWNGVTKSHGTLDAHDDDELSGGLLTLLSEGKSFVKNNSKNPWRKLPNGDGRVNYPEYPMDAVEECIVNGLIHRDYLEIGSEVHIDIFDDRMEVYSPGGMPSGELIQNLDTRSVPSTRRNPIIADLFQRLDLMERRGSGFGKVLDAYQVESDKRGVSVKPTFRSTATGFFVVLPNLNKGFSMVVGKGKTTLETTPETTLEESPRTLVERVGKKAAKIYRLIHANNNITVAEIGEKMGMTTDGAKYNVKKLRMAKLIRFVGNPKSGHWETL